MGQSMAPTCLFLIVILLWKPFHDDVIVLWIHSHEDANNYVIINTIDISNKIRFTMQTENEDSYEFLDLRLKLKGYNKITVELYSKPTNRSTYIDPTTCYPSRNINKIPECIYLRLRRICDSDEKYVKRSNEYQNYLIARNYSPLLIAKQF